MNTKIKDTTAKITFLSLSVILGILGAFVLGYDGTGYLPTIAGLSIGFTLLTEIGFKKFSRYSNLKSLGSQQKFTLILAFLSIVGAVLSLPEIQLLNSIPVFQQVFGVIFVLAGIFGVIEAFN